MRGIRILASAALLALMAWPAHAANMHAALDVVIHKVQLNEEPAERAFEWLNHSAALNMVVSWKHLEAEGIDRNTPITLNLQGVRARTVLKLMIAQLSIDNVVVAQVNNDYIHVRTKLQAANDPVVRIYPIGDMLHEVPRFEDAPEFDLTQIASDKDSSSSPIFESVDTDTPQTLPRSERAELIANAIRDSIEPEIWDANGGRAGKITYYNGMLIVRAPQYVHRRIGIPGLDSYGASSDSALSAPPAPTFRPAYDRRRAGYGYTTRRSGYTQYTGYHASRRSNGVSGIDTTQARRY